MDAVKQLMEYYPKIYFACHTRHVKDPDTGEQISAHQGSILDHLDEVDPIGVSALAKHMGVTPSTMSLNIDRLEKKGYVKRSISPKDARKVEVRISESGLRVREAKSVLDPLLVEGLLNQLGEQDRNEAISGLKKLADAALLFMKSKS